MKYRPEERMGKILYAIWKGHLWIPENKTGVSKGYCGRTGTV